MSLAPSLDPSLTTSDFVRDRPNQAEYLKSSASTKYFMVVRCGRFNFKPSRSLLFVGRTFIASFIASTSSQRIKLANAHLTIFGFVLIQKRTPFLHRIDMRANNQELIHFMPVGSTDELEQIFSVLRYYYLQKYPNRENKENVVHVRRPPRNHGFHFLFNLVGK